MEFTETTENSLLGIGKAERTDPKPEITKLNYMDLQEEDNFYILIPLGVFLAIIVLALVVYLMARNRRRLARIYSNKDQAKLLSYDEDAYDSPLEQDVEAAVREEYDIDNDNPAKSLLGGKLHINNRYENYLSTSYLNKSELFT